MNFIRKKARVKLKYAFIIMLFLVFFISHNASAISWDKYLGIKSGIEQDKIWKIITTSEIDPKSLIGNVKVLDSNNKEISVKITLGEKNNIISVQPPQNGYDFGKTYSLLVSNNITSKNGTKLKSSVKLDFTIVNLAKADYLELGHEPFLSGDSLTFISACKEKSEVQYNAYVYNEKDKSYKNITGGYKEEVQGKNPFLFKYSGNITPGKYTLKVFAKISEARGVNYDSTLKIYYDSVIAKEINCLSKAQSSISVDSDIVLSGNNYKNNNNEIAYKIGEKVTIDGIASLMNTKENFKYKAKAFNVTNGENTSISVEYSDKIQWVPQEAGKYILEIWAKNYTSKSNVDKPYDFKKNIYVNVYNKEITYKKYDITLDEFVDIQYKGKPTMWKDRGFVNADKESLSYYLNPKSFIDDENDMYQFLTLNYIDGINVEDLNKILEGKGVLSGKGKVFLEASKKYDVNVAYLISHALLETGNGTSKLSNGSIEVKEVDGKPVTPRKTYNMFGIRAVDSNPEKCGSEYAYKQGWFTVDAAIMGGAEWIPKEYINSTKYKQNTLYKMRWNVEVSWHQYATDIGWAQKQVSRMKKILDECKTAYLVFEIPEYKK